MVDAHPLLLRQLRRLGLGPDGAPEALKWPELLERISRTYHDADQDRYLLERSLELSSNEMRELYESLRERSETKLAVERNRLRAVIGSLGAGLMVLDPHGRIRALNPEAERLLASTEAALVGRRFAELLVEDDVLDESSDSLQKSVSAGRPGDDAAAAPGHARRVEDTGIYRADGRVLRVSYALNPMIEDGQLTGAVVVFLDISARKAAEEERDRFFRLSLDLLCVLRPDGVPQRLNPAWQRLGYTVDELMKQNMLELVHPADRVRTLRAVAALDETGVARRYENRIRCKDGSYRWLQWAAVLGDEPRFIYAVARDVTEEKAREKELEVAKEAAEAATRTKSTFLANMSHEMRTPLNAIIGITGLLMNSALAPEVRELLRTVAASSNALLAVINDVLDYSKIEAGMMDMVIRPFALIECIESSMDLLASRAAERGLELILDIDDSVPKEARGDAGRLRQVLLNLLSNAVKFTPEGGEVVLSARATRADLANGQESGWKLFVAVRDTGVGIAPEDQARLFSSFTQLDSGRVRQQTGTGLGLAISRELCHLMGGEIWVDSTPGLGSTFRFTVSLGSHGAEHAVPSDTPLCGARVLLAVANRTSRALLSRRVELLGAAVLVASDATEACALLDHEGPVHVALIDVALPAGGADAPDAAPGILLANEIRARSRDAVRIVLMTGFDQHDVRSHAPVDVCLSKPIKARHLVHALSAPLDTDRPRRRRARSVTLDNELADNLPLAILVAEDNPINQQVTRKVLERMGYSCTIADNGAHALLEVTEDDYDVVLMDMQMPEMDGLEAARAIRERGQDITQPIIIAMTANASAADREACLEAGMDGFISKPVPVEELQAAIKRWGPLAMERRRARHAARARPANGERPRPATES